MWNVPRTLPPRRRRSSAPGLAAQAEGEGAQAPLVDGRAVVVDEEQRDVLAVAEQALADERGPAAPGPGDHDAVAGAAPPVVEHAADRERRLAARPAIEERPGGVDHR